MAEIGVQFAERAVELSPNSGGWLNTVGAAYYRAGQYQAAIDALRRAREYHGLDFVGSDGYFLAMAYARDGDADTELRWFEISEQWTVARAASDQELVSLRIEAAEVLGLGLQPLKVRDPDVLHCATAQPVFKFTLNAKRSFSYSSLRPVYHLP